MAFGKKATVELDTTGDEKGDLCGACAIDGLHRPALKFCLECSQPIYKYCVDSHRIIKQIQHHKLVDNKNKDAVKITQTLSSILACGNHPDKKIELICIDNDVLCCSTCATVNHRSCRQVNEVSKIATVTNTEGILKQLIEVKNYIEELVKQHQNNNQDIQSHINTSIRKQVQEINNIEQNTR